MTGEPRCGVAGSPIAHSLSPVLHRAAYDALGLDWEYDAHDVDEAGLPAFLHDLGDEWRGLSLTMPLKQAVLAHCTSLTDAARRVTAVNTVVVGATRELLGDNTDVPGFVAAWREAGFEAVDHAVVLGGGATARSAVAALADIGATRVTALVRAPGRADLLGSLLSDLVTRGEVSLLSEASSLRDVDLLVSTVPAAAQDDLVTVGPLSDLMGSAAAFFDVAYGPQDSAFIELARRVGVPCADGFGLLLHQAARQVELMTGQGPAPVEPMRAAGLAALSRGGEATGRQPGASSEV